MFLVEAEKLEAFACRLFEVAGASSDEAYIVGHALVQASLTGVDSHGVMRIPEYIRWIESAFITVNAHVQVIQETQVFAVVDGGWGFGQVVARKAMELAIHKASNTGVGVALTRRCGHIGRVGDYTLMAAERQMAGVLFVNTHGGGKLVAPWGGIDRRLSANPISIAIPRPPAPPILIDISTSTVSEGKVRNALNQHRMLSDKCIVDSEGRPSSNPADLYGPPAGALVPFGGHKGFGLALATDILAGALSGAGCSSPDTDRVANSFMAIAIDIPRIRAFNDFLSDVDHLIEYVKSSRLAPGFSAITIPGEPECRELERRTKEGIPIDEHTWRELCHTGECYGIHINS